MALTHVAPTQVAGPGGEHVSGLIAIIADGPAPQVSTSELRAFADAFGSVHGRNDPATILEQRRVCACIFDGPDDAVRRVERRGESWTAFAGVAHHSGSLMEATVDDLEGQFALLRHDAASGTVTLASDPFGMFGLFVARRDHLTYASTSALALARHLGAEPSRIGIETFLLTGYQCGARTGWDEVERVAGGIVIEFDEEGIRESEYWRPRIELAIRRLSIEGAVERCLEEAAAAVALAGRRPGPVWCDLTGGYDSRLLTLLARGAGLEFMTSTSGDEGAPDVRLAEQVARSAGWDWTWFRLPDTWQLQLPERLGEALGWGDSALEVLQLASVLWTHEMKAQRSHRLLNGGGGEHYWSYAWQHEYGRAQRPGRADLDRWIRSRMLRAVPTEVFKRDPRPRVIADLRARLGPVIEPYLDQPRATQADILYAHKSTGHFGAYAAAGGAHVDVLLPFYTRPSFTAAISTNPRFRFGHRFYRRLIHRIDPGIAALATTKGGPAQPPRPGNLLAYAPYYLRLGERGINKLAQAALGRSFRRAPTLHDASAAAARAAAILHVGASPDGWRSRNLYDGVQLDRLLRDAGRSDFPHSVLLGRILTVEMALRAADAALEG